MDFLFISIHLLQKTSLFHKDLLKLLQIECQALHIYLFDRFSQAILFNFPYASLQIDYFTTITHLLFSPLSVTFSISRLCFTVTIISSKGLSEIEIIVLSVNHLSRTILKSDIYTHTHTKIDYIYGLFIIATFCYPTEENLLLKES